MTPQNRKTEGLVRKEVGIPKTVCGRVVEFIAGLGGVVSCNVGCGDYIKLDIVIRREDQSEVYNHLVKLSLSESIDFSMS